MDCIGLRQVNQLEGQTYSRPVRELRPRQTGCCRACRHLTQRTLIRYGPGLNPETELRAKANFSGAHVERAFACWYDRQSGQSRFAFSPGLGHYLRWQFWAIRRRPTRAPPLMGPD